MFFRQVFPALFPMFIINDILLNYNFCFLVDYFLGKIFRKVFKMSSVAGYVFLMSLISGTPTNAYLVTNLVLNGKLTSKDASVILSYACFLNPIFLYNILNGIFNDTTIVLKLMMINYGVNWLIAFLWRNYPYKDSSLTGIKSLFFTKVLAQSIEKSFKTLTIVLGTIIFYLMLCEGLNILVSNPLFNCFINGLLETTGGLSKIAMLYVSVKLKVILSTIFIGFMGLSIHSQIKNIVVDADISLKYFFWGRILQVVLSTIIAAIIT